MLLLAASTARPQTAARQNMAPDREQVLPTGMSITPYAVPGVQIQSLNPDLAAMPEFTADHPISTALSPDGHTLLVLTSGYNKNFDVKAKGIPGLSDEYVFVYDVSNRVPLKQQVLHVPNTYVGLAWAPDGQRFFVSGGQDDSIHVFVRREPTAAEERNDNAPAGTAPLWIESTPAIALGHTRGLGFNDSETVKDKFTKPLAAGLAVSRNGKQLAVANSMNDSVSLIDIAAKKVVAELDLRPGKINPAQKGVPGGEYPYGVAFKGNNKVYVSSLRDREIVVIEIRGGVPAVTARIKTRGQPAKMVMNKAQSLLFAVADNSDSVVVVDAVKDELVAEIKTVTPASMASAVGSFKGANPNSLALAPDEKTLYVTNGGTNSAAVIRLERDPDDSQVIGLIPTGWYPTSVTVSSDGKWIYVTNAKSPAGPNPGACRDNFNREGDRPCALKQQFVFQLEKGSLAAMPVPSAAQLGTLTAQVARNDHFEARRNTVAEKELFSFLRSKIQHVIYIVKENRTYDQVLGDLGRGNSDAKLNLFPEAMTPNHHALAREFVTLDNFYDSGEVSGLGWNWSTAARATDFVERTIPIDYALKGIGYDVEGINRGINVAANSPQERTRTGPLDPDDLPGPADVAAPDGPEDESGAGYLWDAVLRAKKTLRNYGFFVDLAHYSATKDGGPPLPLIHEPSKTYTQVAFPTKQALQGVTDLYFRGFDMRFPDYWRFKEWEREFDEYVRQDNLPSLELLRLPHDHFGNFAEAIDGVNTVETMIADNDYAIALVAEKIARSKYAGSTLIFIIEDDA
ncbi:MAG TPA: YncE family protein, partial [Candidatus Limnocylindrales bacterium]|nr:YncE family protein [Candidatus Limnocylindrales bacterium]